MLFDRMCPGGGWNAGKGTAFGMPYSAYIDATAIALLALAEHEKQPGVQTSLAWLMNRLPGCPSPYSLAWGTLALSEYRDVNREVEKTLERTTNALSVLIERVTGADDPCTVAVCALALEAAEGDNGIRGPGMIFDRRRPLISAAGLAVGGMAVPLRTSEPAS